MAVSISGKVNTKITGLGTPTRSGNTMSFKWTVPKAAYDDKNNKRAEWVDAYLYFVSNDVDAKKKSKPLNQVERRRGQTFDYTTKTKGHDRIWCRDYGNQMEEISQKYRRDVFHPVKKGRYLKKVCATVWLGNGKGDHCGQATSPNYVFEPPRKPKLSTPTISAQGNNQRISSTITHDEGTDKCEYYDMLYCITRKDNLANSSYKKETIVSNSGKWTTSARGATSITSYRDMGDVLNLTPGRWIRITFKAYARGIAGNSDTATASHLFAWPATPEIKSVNVTGTSTNSVITVNIRTNSTDFRPVDTVELERAITEDSVDKASEIPVDAWQPAAGGVMDNSNCVGFSETVGDSGIQLLDENSHHTGKRLWYRVRNRHDTYSLVSSAVEVKQLHFEPWTAENVGCKIDSITDTKGEEGSAVTLKVSWTAAANTATSDTEISWSDKYNAWDSSKLPNTCTTATSNYESSTGRYYCNFTVKDLVEGEKYTFKARRHGTDVNGNESYGLYSTPKQHIPVSTPTNVQLTAPDSVVRGKSIQFTWTYDGGVQKEWTIQRILTGNKVTGVKSGKSKLDGVIVPFNAWWTGDELSFRVGVKTGGSWGYSSAVTVSVLDKPAITSLSYPGVVTKQPLTFDITTDTKDVDIICKVLADGMVIQEPDKKFVQAPGDYVWSKKVSMQNYTTSNDGTRFSGTVKAPTGLRLLDGAGYTLSVTVVDPSSGLSSDEATRSFSMNYTAKPIAPSKDSHVWVVKGSKQVLIQPLRDTAGSTSDKAEIYRVTPSGIFLIADNVPFGKILVDKYPPYSKRKDFPLFYRIATRTADGLVAWRDISYNIHGYQIRFDWGEDDFVELPYNMKYSFSWTKSFEGREYFDESLPVGYWNDMVKRTATLSTEIIRLEDQWEFRKIQELATYPGPVFVRTPEGSAFCANVEVSGLPNNYNSLTQEISFKATEIALVDNFKTIDYREQ